MTENPFRDRACHNLACYLQKKLNESHPEQTIVQSTRSYDAFNVPYTDYPLLKVYRLSDDGAIDLNQANCQAVISYSLVLPELEKLAPILAWVRKKIRLFLFSYNLEHGGEYPKVDKRYRAEYRNMLNEQTMKVHSFLRFNITIIDSLD